MFYVLYFFLQKVDNCFGVFPFGILFNSECALIRAKAGGLWGLLLQVCDAGKPCHLKKPLCNLVSVAPFVNFFCRTSSVSANNDVDVMNKTV